MSEWWKDYVAPLPAERKKPPSVPATDKNWWAEMTVPVPSEERLRTAPLDERRGASLQARLSAALMNNPEEVLAAARKFYPDAVWKRIGGVKRPRAGLPQADEPERDAIVFTHPETKRRTVFDPAGLDPGDLMEIAPGLTRTLASAGGGIAGSFVGGAATGGNPAGAMAGADIGAAALSQGADELMRRGAKKVLGIPETRSTKEQVTQLAAGTVADLALGRLGSKVAQAIKDVRIHASRLNKFAPQGFERPEVLADLKAAGISTAGAAGLVNESPNVSGALGYISRVPQSAPAMAATRREMQEGIQAYGQDVLTALAPGGQAFPSIKEWAATVRATAGRTVSELDSLVKQGTAKLREFYASPHPGSYELPELHGRLRSQNTQDYFLKLRSELTGLPASEKTRMGGWLRAVESDLKGALGNDVGLVKMGPRKIVDNGVPWKSFWHLRDEIGGKTSGAPLDNSSKKLFNGLYAAMTRDLETFFATVDSPIPRGTPNRATSGVVAKWEEMQKAYVTQMARLNLVDRVTKGGFFDANMYLREWPDLRPDEKKVVVGGNAETAAGLDRLYRIVAANAKSNRAGAYRGAVAQAATARDLGEKLAIATTPWSPTGRALRVLGNYAFERMDTDDTARLFNDPKFVDWLADASRLPLSTPQEFTTHIARLAAMATNRPLIRDAIRSYIAALGGDPPTFDISPTVAEQRRPRGMRTPPTL